MVINQTVQCPHCSAEYASRIEFAPDQQEASEKCTSCRQMVYIRILTDNQGNLGGIEIHPTRLD